MSTHTPATGKRVPSRIVFIVLSLVSTLTLATATGRMVVAGKSPNLAALTMTSDNSQDEIQEAAVMTGLNWQIETVSSATGTDIFFTSSLELDTAGQPRVSYYDPGAGDLRYGYRDGSGWHTEPVDTGGDVGEYSSLALDTDGHPHISYYDASNLRLRYAAYNGSSWTPVTVDGAVYTGESTSLALDSSDNPHISYYRGGSCTDGSDNYCNLRYAYYDGSWNPTRLHYSTAKLGQFTSLALDSEDEPHISYYHADNGDLRYLYHTAGGWQWDLGIADSAGSTGADTSLRLDDNDNPHIAYWNVGASNLMYATHNGTSWITDTVDSAGAVGRSASLALDSAGHPHISYYDLTNDTLKYAYHDGSTWHTEPVASTGNVDGHEGTSLELDARDLPHITFYTTSGLRYAFVEPTWTYLPLVMRDYPHVDRYAVIVGVADYLNDSMPPPCMLSDLPYPDQDAAAMRQALLDVGGFESSDILMLTNSQATKAGIQNAVTDWLASREDADDLVVFFFAGHGGQLSDVSPYGDELDGVDEFLIPHDWACDAGDTAISDDEFDTWLDTLDSQHVVVLLDSCHSGGMTSASAAGEGSCRCRCVPSPLGVVASAVAGDGLIQDIDQSGRLVLAATKEEDYAYECDSLQHGVFSYYLLQSLHTTAADTHDHNGWVSGEEAFDYLRPRVEAELCYMPWFQYPQISDGIPGEEDLTQP